ncbi:MAG TPA: hypothetical protein VK215_04315 [Acidimicrobiales bacterium]|nr:hypothetical protein [Acidimicrobiales bacterium]
MTQTRGRPTFPRPRQSERRPRRGIAVAAQVVGGALLVAGIVLALVPSDAEAATLTAGPVTLTPGSPYHSGQSIDITVAANATLAASNRATAGFPSGAVAIKVEECADPGGLSANLPKKPSQCDYNTVDSVPGAGADGSLIMKGYTMYALPDAIVFGEPSDQTPACGSGQDECVLGIFTNLNDFTKPHIFSGPFNVGPDPQAENAIVNGSPSPAVTGHQATAAATSPSTLANTGDPGLPWLLGGGSALLVAGTLSRRLLRRSRAVAGAVPARSGSGR